MHTDEAVADPYEFTGFIRCSLYFAREQKERMKDFPPLPNKLKVGKAKKQTKLIYSLFDADDYCIFSEFLKQLLENDWCALDRIHEVVKMHLGPLMRSFIDAKTAKRQESENIIKECEGITPRNAEEELELEWRLSAARAKKDVAKLDNNSCFGKTMQSDERYDTSKVVRDQKQFMRCTIGKVISDFNVLAPPAADGSHQGAVEVKLKKARVTIRCPKYLGAAILAYSKMLMLDFVYNCFASTFKPEEFDILYTDTDSIYLAIKNEAIRDYSTFLQRFEPSLRELHFAAPSDITPGKMKLEKELTEAVFLKPKLYSYLDSNSRQTIKTKGVRIEQNYEALSFQNYKKALFDNERIIVRNRLFLKQGKIFMFTIDQTKVGLSNDDDKREWKSIQESRPRGYDYSIFTEDAVMEKISTNCASRVDVTQERFLQLLGCSVDQFKTQLLSELPLYCSFINYGYKWNIDHKQPISAFPEKTEEALRALCQHTNLTPMTI